jgi:hypothetical protein
MLPLRDSAKNFIYPTNLPQCGKPNKRVGPGAWSQRCFREKDDMGGGQNIKLENELITGQKTNFAQSQNYLNENIGQVGLTEINYLQNEPVSRPPAPRRTSCGQFQNVCLGKNKRGTDFLPVAPTPYPLPLSPKVPGAAQHTSTRCSEACSRTTAATNIHSKTHIFLININMVRMQKKSQKKFIIQKYFANAPNPGLFL